MKKVPVVDVNKCTGCNACINACPVNAISLAANTVCAKCIKYCIAFTVPCLPKYILFDYERCTSCGLCVKSCSSQAITLMDIDRAIEEKSKNI